MSKQRPSRKALCQSIVTAARLFGYDHTAKAFTPWQLYWGLSTDKELVEQCLDMMVEVNGNNLLAIHMINHGRNDEIF